jgi:hypothetical protein
VLALVLILSLVACGDKNDNSSGNGDSSSTTPPITQSETEDPSVSPDVSEAPPVSTGVSGDKYPVATPIIPDGLSSNPESFQFSLDGNILTLPALYSDFTSLGWTHNDIDGKTLRPGFAMVGSSSLRKGDAALTGAFFINLSDKELPLSECHVYGFAFSYGTSGAVSTSFVLPGGLHIGSTVDDIIATYGEPTEKDDSGSGRLKLKYEFSDGNFISFEIDKAQPPYWNRIAIYREDSSSD